MSAPKPVAPEHVGCTPVASGGEPVHATDADPYDSFACGGLLKALCGRTIRVTAVWKPGTFGRHATEVRVEGRLTCRRCARRYHEED